MKTALLTVFLIGVLAYAVLGFLRKGRNGGSTFAKDDALDASDGLSASNGEQDNKRGSNDCFNKEGCGIDCFCDDKQMAMQMSEEIIYFEDEELDAFKNIPADSYSEEQVSAFSEVLTTLQPIEVAGWLHSLHLRGINLPQQLMEEARIMMD